ncbi:hypothetical protein E8E13_005074 [Curvularia kusanoi]|uniref:MIOS-like alpha-solenoid domain-containing protein n=1 Tax=Curvularia kusanoi TaxID=90978 RepID=A0A9P4TKY7_CURKU|nr:hypothetical protein E8E13_005074 [Curvularia kusanoi]
MEAAIRWSPHSSQEHPRFLIIDVAGNRLRLCEIEGFSGSKVKYRQLLIRDKLPNYTAFDWSKKDPDVVAIGSASGEAHIVQLDPNKPEGDFLHAFPIRHQRKCNTIAFSQKNLLATGLDRVRNDVCLNIYDMNDARFTTKDEPYKKLASSEAVSSIKFFTGQPDTLLAGVQRQYVRIYDLRDSGTQGIANIQTKQVHNIAIDPLDENYFMSAGTTGDPTVTVWDQRMVKQRNDNNGAILEYKPIVDNSQPASIWSLRYSGTKKGTFGVLANTGEFKILEIAQHSHHLETLTSKTDTAMARAWSLPHYTKVSHHLRHPWHSKDHPQKQKDRVMAYDFMTNGSPLDGQCALALHANREVEVIRVPPPAPRINVSALEEIYKDRTAIARPRSRHGTAAEDLGEIQDEALSRKNEHGMAGLSEGVGNLSISQQQAAESREREDILRLAYPDVKVPLADYLAFLEGPKRRCQEGYSLGCTQNKAIVANDPWLADVWDFVERMDKHAHGDGMVGNGLELNYLGIESIWNNDLEMYDDRRIDPDAATSQNMFRDAVKEIVEAKEFPPFSGAETKFPENRQLCLSLCGWPLDKKGVEDNCENLIADGQALKAVVLAVFQGYKDVALALLRTALQQGKLPQDHIGLGAVIACASPTSGVPAAQRQACAWMAEMTTDPYLKSLLTYFISADWNAVVDTPSLVLADRVAVALKYLPDGSLSQFLSTTTTSHIRNGSISGLLLTGLTARALDLLQVHIAAHPAELQTAVLLLSRACPLYIQDPRWYLWKDAYLSEMQVWRTFLERTRYTKEHNARSIARDGGARNKPAQPSIAIRCAQCQQNLALRKEPRTAKSRLVPVAGAPYHPGHPSNPKSAGGLLGQQHKSTPQGKHTTSSPALACPNCGAQMPRCGLCMMWLGSPDPGKPGGAETLRGEDLESRLMVFSPPHLETSKIIKALDLVHMNQLERRCQDLAHIDDRFKAIDRASKIKNCEYDGKLTILEHEMQSLQQRLDTVESRLRKTQLDSQLERSRSDRNIAFDLAMSFSITTLSTHDDIHHPNDHANTIKANAVHICCSTTHTITNPTKPTIQDPPHLIHDIPLQPPQMCSLAASQDIAHRKRVFRPYQRYSKRS